MVLALLPPVFVCFSVMLIALGKLDATRKPLSNEVYLQKRILKSLKICTDTQMALTYKCVFTFIFVECWLSACLSVCVMHVYSFD